MSEFTGRQEDNLGWQESQAYADDPDTAKVPDRSNNAHTIGSQSFKIAKYKDLLDEVSQAASDVTDAQADATQALDDAASAQATADAAIPATEKGLATGVCPLDGSGLVDAAYLPSYVDDVLEVADFASLPVTGESGKIYVTIDTGFTYRWSGSIYVQLSNGVELGETSTTAYRGDRGKIAYDHSQDVTTDVHSQYLQKVGGALSGVLNLSDSSTTPQISLAAYDTGFYFDSAAVRTKLNGNVCLAITGSPGAGDFSTVGFDVKSYQTYKFGIDGGCSISRYASDSLYIATGAASRMTITNAGIALASGARVNDITNAATGLTDNDTSLVTGAAIKAYGDANWASGTSISDVAYAASWDGDTTNAPSKNAVYDQMESIDKGDFIAATFSTASQLSAGNTSLSLTKNAGGSLSNQSAHLEARGVFFIPGTGTFYTLQIIAVRYSDDSDRWYVTYLVDGIGWQAQSIADAAAGTLINSAGYTLEFVAGVTPSLRITSPSLAMYLRCFWQHTYLTT